MKKQRKMISAVLAAAVVLPIALVPAFAVQPDEVLSDPKLEARARELSQDLRCLVCQNQSIDDSNAPLAKDLRVIVRERLTAGDTNEQVIAFLVARYGHYVLLKPPMQANTALLWIAPFAFMMAALFAAVAYLRGTRRQPENAKPEGLSEDDMKLLKQAMQDK